MVWRPAWMDDAKCAQHPEPEVFFSDRTGVLRSRDEALAKLECSHCPVIKECLEFALDNDIEHGVWGGMGARDRRLYVEESGRGRGRRIQNSEFF